MQSERKNRLLYILGIMIILLGIGIGTIPFLIKENNKMIEKEKIDVFFETVDEVENTANIIEEVPETNNEKSQIEENYSMVLEIPKINLKKGLYDIKSKYNSVKYNIQIMKESKMPNIKNSNLCLLNVILLNLIFSLLIKLSNVIRGIIPKMDKINIIITTYINPNLLEIKAPIYDDII